MSVKQLKDWSSWWDGLRTSMMKAGATSVTTNLTVFMTTNGVSSLNIPGMTNTGEGWRTALIALVAQFLLHTIYAAALYVQNNPDAQTITIDTTFTSKNQKTGVEVTQASTTTTTTPVDKTP